MFEFVLHMTKIGGNSNNGIISISSGYTSYPLLDILAIRNSNRIRIKVKGGTPDRDITIN